MCESKSFGLVALSVTPNINKSRDLLKLTGGQNFHAGKTFGRTPLPSFPPILHFT
jgi:hypothetical protein